MFSLEDEDLLLDSALVCTDVADFDDLDEAILDDESHGAMVACCDSSATATLANESGRSGVEVIDDDEELDYEEEVDCTNEKAVRSGKFTSERSSSNGREMAVSISHEESPVVKALVTPVVVSNVFRRVGACANFKNVQQPRFSIANGSKSSPHSSGRPVFDDILWPRFSNRNNAMRQPRVLINPHYRGAMQPVQVAWRGGIVRGVSPLTRFPSQPQNIRAASLQHIATQNALPTQLRALPGQPNFMHPPPPTPVFLNAFAPPPRIYPARNPGYSTGENVCWNRLVDGFLQRTISGSSRRSKQQRQKSFSSSSSRSRSYSSHSRSSYSSHNSSSSYSRRSRSRDQSYSRHFPSAKKRSRNHYSRDRIGGQRIHIDRKRQHLSKSYARMHPLKMSKVTDIAAKSKESSEFDLENTLECAKLIGLDREYLAKVAEQKRIRDAILKKKEERRGLVMANRQRGISKERSLTSATSMRPSGSDQMNKRNTERDRRIHVRTIERKAKTESGVSADSPQQRQGHKSLYTNYSVRSGNEQELSIGWIKGEAQGNVKLSAPKRKAYLAVVVGTRHAEKPDEKTIRSFARETGRVKKLWCSNGKFVKIVFENHDDAKKFMLNYNRRSVNGVQLSITLEKVFDVLNET